MMQRTFVFLSLIVSVFSQDLGVPLSWRKFSNERPLDERIRIAQNGINAIIPQLNAGTAEFNDIGFWQSGNVYSAMANQDHIAGTTVNRDRVVNGLNTAFNLNANYDKFGWWAQSAVYAYRAYRDDNLLSHAVATWNRVSAFVITAAQASAGKTSVKSFSLAGSCDGVTMAGGVFWRPTTDDQLYLTLSAYLAEITNDAKYKNAAILSAQWIKAHNINSNNIVLDTVNGHDCSRSPANWLFTYNSGKYIEGLSVLAAITGDAQWTSLYTNIANSAMKTNVWEGSDGIITEGASPQQNNDGVGFKAVFIRGLHEAFSRSSNQALKILIHSYIDVQYNALLDLAANGDTYSSAWHGPSQSFTTWGQLAALDVLVSAIDAN
ncbi:hypothetical protein E1B28_007051 [Marasmius oreades]|uniref:Endo-1,6-alpha-mannosidase n=1 Tax=Marasmius oreades TaxID=181124 RepID=A0A9P7S0U2_9AGAR|nr:uncharacterized protein E1B28_007051 [Marasmius oreades]KAG7093369.1 hypothetical protein E1B28_007051 [Marasmius oreades]